ncbi:MAG: quinone-dependent dihydroorotate dehydrogenase [Elusimicrobiota bacterium]|jgi:dihydroorotate dehydrogenase
MSVYEDGLRPWLFRLDPETAHELALDGLRLAGLPGLRGLLRRAFSFEHPSLPVTVAGLRFPNPVGLAAGFDKDAEVGPGLCTLGFGFLEFGTLTVRPQNGNPKPRLFRFPEREAVINRMGFNNRGAQAAAKRLAAFQPSAQAAGIPIGVNIGINKDVPAEKAPEEYAEAFKTLRQYGDYFVVNVSSPNTQGLRRLQERLRLEKILCAIQCENTGSRPLFVKLAPDLEDDALADLLPLLMKESSGVVCTNTTLSREGLPDRMNAAAGGLSGAPLRERSTAMIRKVRRLTQGRLPIIGSGGILSAEDAYQKLRAGASLVQIYTGMIYRGPALVKDILQGLTRILNDHGLENVSQATALSQEQAVSLEAR